MRRNGWEVEAVPARFSMNLTAPLLMIWFLLFSFRVPKPSKYWRFLPFAAQVHVQERESER